MKKRKYSAENVNGTSLAENLPENQFLTLFTDEQQDYKMQISYYKGKLFNVAIEYIYEKMKDKEEEYLKFYIRNNKTGRLTDKNYINILNMSNYEIQEIIKEIINTVQAYDQKQSTPVKKEPSMLEIDNELYFPYPHEVRGIYNKNPLKYGIILGGAVTLLYLIFKRKK